MIYIFMANGTEEIEALIPLDVWRRAGLDVKTVSINQDNTITSSHGVRIVCDSVFGEDDYADADLIFIPGGLPGADHLNEHEGVGAAVTAQAKAGKRLAAICAGPKVLATKGLLSGRKATCYPGCETPDAGVEYTHELVVTDGNITTGEGPGAAFSLAYEIVTLLKDAETAERLKEGMRFNHLLLTRDRV